MKISVIIPVYNANLYIEQLITNLLASNFDDFEIICINDGSTDNSLDILKKFKTVKVINQRNQGQSIARNNGLKVATGDYIIFLDADDDVRSHFIDTIIKNLEDYDVLMYSYEVSAVQQNKEVIFKNKTSNNSLLYYRNLTSRKFPT